jgi:competence protein ComEA
MIRRFLDNYFGFNRQQRNGLLVLVLLSLSLLIFRKAFPLFIRPGPMELLDLPLVPGDSLFSNTAAAPPPARSGAATELFHFDPNQVSAEQLQRLGFPERSVKALLNFRKKGFVFRKKEDLKKVYGLSEVLYEQLAPYVRITPPADPVHTPGKSIPFPADTSEKLDLNSADSLSLTTLRGIGPVYASRIIKYRALLGGYVNTGQLREVYGLTEEVFDRLKDRLEVRPGSIKKLRINTADFRTLTRHPYLGYETTRLIVNARRKAPVDSAGLRALLNDEQRYTKLLPYLDFQTGSTE